MRLPNLLATRNGRLAAFFLLYTTEGVPLGFAATAVATQLRRMGVGPAEIGAFVAAFYLPWAFKWAFGPAVDVFRSRTLGHRRAWILGTQAMMVATLLALLWVPLPQGLALFTGILLVHNTFAAMQDVAIDALAVNSLGEDERGLANGLMFAGASVGQALGGAGVLVLIGWFGLDAGFVAVALAILAVTAFVVLPMKEAWVAPPEAAPGQSAASLALEQMRDFAQQAMRSFLGSRAAYAGVFFALLPAGAMSLSLSLQSSLAVEVGMTDDGVAFLALISTLASGVCMVLGGWLADRLGRRGMLTLFIALMSLPVLYLGWVLQQAGYISSRPPGSTPIPELISQLRIATVCFAMAMGLMYGVRSAVFMDITNPRVAATQFTAYMALMNLAIAFAATWQGVAIEALGYPATLLIDALVGPLCLLLLPFMKNQGSGVDALCDNRAERRARTSAAVLGLLCLAFVPWWLLHNPKGATMGLANTLFTLVFVASALFLLAGTLLQQLPAQVLRVCRVLALGLLLLYLRRFVGPDGAMALQALLLGTAVAGALALLYISRAPWPGLATISSAAPGARPGQEPAAA